MNRLKLYAIGLAGLAGLVCFLWIGWQSQDGQTVIQLGFPDTWLSSYDGPKGSGTAAYFTRWSMAFGVLGFWAVTFAIRSWQLAKIQSDLANKNASR